MLSNSLHSEEGDFLMEREKLFIGTIQCRKTQKVSVEAIFGFCMMIVKTER